MDIINAYEETGSLRAAAALCGTTHKTVKRVLERREAGQRPGRRRTPAQGLPDSFTDLIFREGEGDGWADHREAAAAATARGRLYGFGAHVAAGGRGAEGRVEADAAGLPAMDAGTRWAPAHRLRHRHAGPEPWVEAVHRGVAVVAVAVRAVHPRRIPGNDVADARRVLRGGWWGARRGSGRPDGLLEGRRGRQRGRADRRLCAIRGALPVPAGLLRGP